MALTFQDSKDAILIAHVYGGKADQKRIYISFEENVPTVPLKDPFLILNDKWFLDRKKDLKTTELIRLQNNIIRKRIPDDEELEPLYNEAIEFLNKQQGRQLILDDGRIVPTLWKKPTIRTYTCGATGSGKTVHLVNYCKEILLRAGNRKKKIFVLSVLNDDKALDDLGVLRIKLDASILKKPITLDELKNSICIFDDVETIPDVKIRKNIENLKEQCLSEGRHHGICTLCTNHQITDYKKTRPMLFECEMITFFPQSGGLNGLKRLLTTYIGVSKDEMKKILSLPSRWVTIFNRYPLACIYESGVFLLGDSTNKVKYNKPLETVDIHGDTNIKESDSDDEIDRNIGLQPHKTIII